MNKKESRKLEREYHAKLLSQIFPREEIREFFSQVSNPAKYPQVITTIKRFMNEIKKNKELFSKKDYFALNNWLEDELACAILLVQDTKCNPFKFINFSRKS
ncbi:MAG: hypothetical protein ACTSU4_06265 [Promethearchaeota archaeon]